MGAATVRRHQEAHVFTFAFGPAQAGVVGPSSILGRVTFEVVVPAGQFARAERLAVEQFSRKYGNYVYRKVGWEIRGVG